VFQIGVADADYRNSRWRELPGLSANLPHDADFEVGRSDPKKDWPWIQPGPTDAWLAAARIPSRSRLTCPEVSVGYYRLVLDFVDTHGAEPPGLDNRHQRHGAQVQAAAGAW